MGGSDFVGREQYARHDVARTDLSYRLCSIGYTLYLRAVQLFSLFVWLTFPGRVHMTCTLSVARLWPLRDAPRYQP